VPKRASTDRIVGAVDVLSVAEFSPFWEFQTTRTVSPSQSPPFPKVVIAPAETVSPLLKPPTRSATDRVRPTGFDRTTRPVGDIDRGAVPVVEPETRLRRAPVERPAEVEHDRTDDGREDRDRQDHTDDRRADRIVGERLVYIHTPIPFSIE
jgi:hypothetical protein